MPLISLYGGGQRKTLSALILTNSERRHKMVSVNTNIASIGARNNLMGNNLMINDAFEKLSSGNRINKAGDDAAGLQIANSMTSQINGLKMAAKNAGDGISLVNTVDGALAESTEILQRMRELAVQSSSDTNSGQDRVFIQDEINALNTELNRIAATTEFNGMKLLDGSFTNMELQVGQDVGQTVYFGVNNMDNRTLGSYEVNSTVETVAADSYHATNGTYTAGAVDTHALAKSGLNALYTTDADYTVSGFFGTKTANVSAGADARDVAKAFNLISGTTGVNATAITRARIEHISANDTYSMTLEGKSTTASTVTFTITDKNDISAMKDAINSVSGSTGITASMVEGDNSQIDLVQEEGYDIIIGDWTGQTTPTASGVTSFAASGADAVVTMDAAHGFSVGDIVRYDNTANTIAGNVVDLGIYRVGTVPSSTTLTLVETDGTSWTYGGNGDGADTLTLINAATVQTLSADSTTGALTAGNTTVLNSDDATSTTKDSTAILGQVNLASHKNFTLTPGASTNHFNAGTTTVIGSLNTMGDIDLKTVLAASKAIGIIDKAIMMVDNQRSKMGALNNRLESTVDNLSNITVKTEESLSRIMDADFAAETTELSKFQVLSQAATAMLAQANQQPQNVLRLVQA